MRELALSGIIAIGFGWVPWWVTGEIGLFSAANFLLGALVLLAAFALALRRARGASAPAYRRSLVRGAAAIGMAVAAAVVLERAAAFTGLSFDWSFERKFELSEATRIALRDLGQVHASLYHDAFDPRTRGTRLLLQEMASTGHLRFDQKLLEEHPEEEDCFAIGTSNTVVVRVGEGPPCEMRFQTVERPTEGTLYEALFRLRSFDARLAYVSRGAGEGDLESEAESGYSGLGEALLTEGYRVRQFVLGAVEEIPDDADLVITISPRRPLRTEGLEALERYLEQGGRLVVFLDPGVESSLERILERFGIRPLPGVIVDPASGPVEGDAPGLNPLAHLYDGNHPIGRGLGPNRMTFFRGALSFALRKPAPEDHLDAVVFSSPRAWLHPDLSVLGRREAPVPPPEAEPGYWPLVVTGRYPRADGEARIVAFGDSGLASNRYLRSLYNLDLVLNAIHWAGDREPDITLRPKAVIAGRLQFPIPLQSTLTMFQGLGLLLPELCLIAGAVLWSRRRTA
jgi:hypothetical protein